MNPTEYICLMLNDGLFSDLYHGEFVECGEDIDTVTAHAIVRTLTNDCAVLIAVLQAGQPLGVTLTGLHHLRGQFSGCIELDLVLMDCKPRRRHAPSGPDHDVTHDVPFDDFGGDPNPQPPEAF